MIHQHHNIIFDVGTLVQGETTNKSISFTNVFNNAYNIRKITPYCPCIKVLNYTDYGVYPEGVTSMILEGEEVELVNKWDIDFTIKKSYLGRSSTTVEVILESPFDSEQFVIIEIKYNTISK